MKKALAILLFFGIFFGAGLLAGGNAQASKLSNFLNSLGQQQSEQDQGDVAEQQSDEGYQVVEQPAERAVVGRRLLSNGVSLSKGFFLPSQRCDNQGQQQPRQKTVHGTSRIANCWDFPDDK